MTDPSPIRVVCFDLGGVVVRICRTWEEACARARVAVKSPERFENPALRALRHTITDDYMAGKMTCEEYWTRIAEATDGLYEPNEIRAVHIAWTIDDYAGIAALVERLNAIPALTTACLSNTNHTHWELLATTSPAIGLLRTRLVSHHMGLTKPDPAIYRAAEQALGVGPREVVFFDDLAENIEAARACGWHAHQIDHAGDTAAQIAGHLKSHGIQV